MAEINQEHITLTEEQKRLIKEKFAEKSADILAFFEKIKQHKQQAQTDSSTTTKETEEIKKFINDLTSEVVTVTETKNEIAHEIEEISDFDLDLKQSSAAILQEETSLSLPEAGDVSAISQNIDIQQRVVITDTSGKPVLENGKPKTKLVKYEPQHFSVFNHDNVIFSVTQRSQGVNTAPSQVAYVTRANEYSTPVAHLSVEYIDNLINSSDSPNKEEILAQFAAKKVGDFYVVDVDVASLDSEFNGNIQIKLTDKTSYSIKFGAFGAHLGVNGEHISNEGFPKEIGKEGRFPLDIAVSSYYMTMVDNKHFTLGKNLLQEQSKTLSPEDLFKNSAWSNFIVATLRSRQMQYPDKSFGITLQNPKMECVSVCLPHKNGQEVENQHVEFRVVENSKGKPVCQAYLHLKRDSVTGHSGYLKPKFYTIDSCAIVRDDENNYFLQMNAVDGKFSQKVHIPIDKDLTLDGIKAIMHLDENLFKNSEVIAVRDNISPIKGEKYNNLPVYNVDPSYKSTIIDTKVARLYVEGQQDVSVHAESTTTTTTTTTTTKHNEEIQRIVSKAVEEHVNTTIDTIDTETDISAIAGQFTEKTLEQIIEEVTTTTVDSDSTHIITGGNDGHDGEDGQDGTDGKPGQDGTDGKPGQDGTDGKPGQDGTDGKPGQDGTDGKPGQNGTDGSGNGNGEETNTDQKKKDDEKKFKPLIGRVRTPFKWFKKNAIDKDWFGGLAFFVLLVGAIIPPVAIVGGLFLGLWVGKKTGLTDDWSKMMDEIETSRLPKDKRLERNKELTKQMLKEDCQKAQQREIDRLKNVAKAKVNAYNRLANETPTLKAQAKSKMEKAREALIQEKTDKIKQSKDNLLASIQSQIDGQQAEIDHVKAIKAAQEELSKDKKKLQEIEKAHKKLMKKCKGDVSTLSPEDFSTLSQLDAKYNNILSARGLEKPEDIQAAIDANRAELETFIKKGPGAFKAYIDAHESTIGALQRLKETVEKLSLDTQPVEVVKPERQGLLVGQSAQDLDLLNGAIGDYNDTNTAIAHNTDAPMQEYNQTISTLDANLAQAKASMEQARQDLQVFQEAVKNETDKFSVEYKQKAEEMDKFFQDQIDEIQRKAAEKKAEEERKRREKRAKRIKHETLAENEYVTVDENGLETISIEETPQQEQSAEQQQEQQQEQPAEQQQEQPAEQQPSEDEEIDPETGLPKSRGKGPKGTSSTGAQVGGDGGGGADLGGNGK